MLSRATEALLHRNSTHIHDLNHVLERECICKASLGSTAGLRNLQIFSEVLDGACSFARVERNSVGYHESKRLHDQGRRIYEQDKATMLWGMSFLEDGVNCIAEGSVRMIDTMWSLYGLLMIDTTMTWHGIDEGSRGLQHRTRAAYHQSARRVYCYIIDCNCST